MTVKFMKLRLSLNLRSLKITFILLKVTEITEITEIDVMMGSLKLTHVMLSMLSVLSVTLFFWALKRLDNSKLNFAS